MYFLLKSYSFLISEKKEDKKRKYKKEVSEKSEQKQKI